jgi:hypothetical protein
MTKNQRLSKLESPCCGNLDAKDLSKAEVSFHWLQRAASVVQDETSSLFADFFIGIQMEWNGVVIQ